MNPETYWLECVSQAFDEHGIEATAEQRQAIATDMQMAHDSYSMAFYVPENPETTELRKLKAALERERNKRICERCKGRGTFVSYGPSFTATHHCDECSGTGFVY